MCMEPCHSRTKSKLLTREQRFDLLDPGGHRWGQLGLGLGVGGGGLISLHGSQRVPVQTHPLQQTSG